MRRTCLISVLFNIFGRSLLSRRCQLIQTVKREHMTLYRQGSFVIVTVRGWQVSLVLLSLDKAYNSIVICVYVKFVFVVGNYFNTG